MFTSIDVKSLPFQLKYKFLLNLEFLVGRFALELTIFSGVPVNTLSHVDSIPLNHGYHYHKINDLRC